MLVQPLIQGICQSVCRFVNCLDSLFTEQFYITAIFVVLITYSCKSNLVLIYLTIFLPYSLLFLCMFSYETRKHCEQSSVVANNATCFKI